MTLDRRSFVGTTGGMLAGVAAAGLSQNAQAATNSVGFFNVKDFGAVGDGVTNDRAAIQAAILAANPLGGAEFERNKQGGIVYLPAGTYLVNYIRLQRNVTLMGDGMGTTILQQDGVNTAVIANAGDTEYPIAICNLRIKGTELPSGNGRAARGIYLRSTAEYGGFTVPDGQHVIEKVWIEKSYAEGIYIRQDCRGTSINNCWVKGSETEAGVFINGSDSSIFNTVSRSHAKEGFRVDAGNTRIVSSKAFFCRGGGFTIRASRCHLTSCEAQDNWIDGFRISAFDAMLSGCLADSNQNAGFHMQPTGSGLYGLNLNGFMSIGRNSNQPGKPWTGQGIGVLFSAGSVFKSYFSGIAKANDIEVQNNASFDSISQIQNIVAEGFVPPNI